MLEGNAAIRKMGKKWRHSHRILIDDIRLTVSQRVSDNFHQDNVYAGLYFYSEISKIVVIAENDFGQIDEAVLIVFVDTVRTDPPG